MKHTLLILIVFALGLPGSGFALDGPSTPAGAGSAAGIHAPLLPAAFSGWRRTGDVRTGNGTAAVDANEARVLRELKFERFEEATYVRNGRTIGIKAERFANATGAFGAFTHFLQPRMQSEEFCNQGASDGTRVFFYCANVLVEVTLDKITAMTSSEMRALAAAIPKITGSDSELPKLPLYLPKALRPQARFAIGPEGYSELQAPVAAEQVNFSFDPEIVVSRKETLDGALTMMVIKYPTPKMATVQLKSITDWHNAQPAIPGELTFAAKRSGPLVVIVSGEIPMTKAQLFLDDVNYEADVTWSEPTSTAPRDNIGNLIVAIFYLVGVIILFTLVAGIAFGGIRIVARKYFPEWFVDSPESTEFIQLNLRD